MYFNYNHENILQKRIDSVSSNFKCISMYYKQMALARISNRVNTSTRFDGTESKTMDVQSFRKKVFCDGFRILHFSRF